MLAWIPWGLTKFDGVGRKECSAISHYLEMVNLRLGDDEVAYRVPILEGRECLFLKEVPGILWQNI